MSITIYVPRAGGSTLIIQYTLAPPVIAHPGIATLSDGLHGAASIQDIQIDQATASDVATGTVILSDQG